MILGTWGTNWNVINNHWAVGVNTKGLYEICLGTPNFFFKSPHTPLFSIRIKSEPLGCMFHHLIG